jgi:hypothetical protein
MNYLILFISFIVIFILGAVTCGFLGKSWGFAPRYAFQISLQKEKPITILTNYDFLDLSLLSLREKDELIEGLKKLGVHDRIAQALIRMKNQNCGIFCPLKSNALIKFDTQLGEKSAMVCVDKAEHLFQKTIAIYDTAKKPKAKNMVHVGTWQPQDPLLCETADSDNTIWISEKAGIELFGRESELSAFDGSEMTIRIM